MKTRNARPRGACLFALSSTVLAVAAPGQTPRYRAEFVGAVVGSVEINATGQLAGTTTIGGNLRGWVALPGSALTPLPLPPGRISSTADDLNDAGAIVGYVGSFYSPEFGGVAALWVPNGSGGYSVRELGMLPGHRGSRAVALNNIGDIVGYSTNGTYRYPVLFTAPGGILDLSSTGIFDPQAINDRRVLVDRASPCNRLDLTTMVAQNLGVPPGSYRSSTGGMINASNQVAGLVILATSTSCDRQAARYTDGVGWQVLSTCGPHNGALDLNDGGDVVLMANTIPWVRFEGRGSFRIEDLIVAPVGHWYVLTTSGGAINNSLQIGVHATNTTTNQTGLLLLTPETLFAYGSGCPGSGAFTPTLVVAPSPGNRLGLTVTGGLGGSLACFAFGLQEGSLPLPGGCTLLVDPLLPILPVIALAGQTPGGGFGSLTLQVPQGFTGVVTTQAFVLDPGVAHGFSNTKGWRVTVQ